MEKQPQSFDQIFTEMSIGSVPGMPGNETIRTLAHDVPAQIKIMGELSKLKQTKFISLMPKTDDALIAISLYAGDGVVTKITRTNYTASHSAALPYVLPAFMHKAIPLGKDGEDGITIQNYPFINTQGITDKDVGIMKKNLAECGMVFKDQDDRPANLGRLPDGSLAVLDGDAVMAKTGTDPQLLQRFAAAWQGRIEQNYPDLYAKGFAYAQSPATSFAMRPRQTPSEAASETPAAKKPWYERMLHKDSQSNQRTGK